MILATLFSGIGVPEMAARRVWRDDFTPLFACEIDKFARQAYLANHKPPLKFYDDICALDATPYAGKVDILVGGSPCQDFSTAGLRAGLNGKLGQLIWEYYRVITECKPSVFVYENVRGMASDRGGKTLAEFLEVFRELGYFCHAQILNTKDYGIPQNRERIYIVGFKNAEHYHAFNYAPKEPLSLCIADILESDVHEKYYLSEKIAVRFKPSTQTKQNALMVAGKLDVSRVDRSKVYEPQSIAPCVLADASKGHSPLVQVIGKLDGARDDINRVYGVGGIAPTLTTMQGGNREPKILQRPRGFNSGGEFSISPTINSSHFEHNNVLSHGVRIRRLTPRECLRLQGIDDSEFAIVTSNAQAYKQAGNAMSVNVVEMIFRQILKAQKGEFELRV